MPRKLYWYILRELLKVLLLSTSVLVVVIGFAAAIKPLSDGLLTAGGMAKFVAYSIPTMLVLALPFAAAFASTLVFCRLANDNEILACRASGLSYRAILFPVFLLGIVLTLGTLYMSHWVVPRFYLLAQQQLERDMVNVLVRQVNKRQTVRLPGKSVILYADRAQDVVPVPVISGNTQPTRVLELQGVAVGKLDKDGQLRREGTAQRASAFFFRIKDQTVVMIRLWNVMLYDAETQQFIFSEHSDFDPIQLPNLFKDKLSFLSLHDLRELGEEPERFDMVRERKRDLVEAMATEELTRRLEGALAASTGHGLTLQSSGEKYFITAPQVERGRDGLKLSGSAQTPVQVLESYIGGIPTRRIEAPAAALSIDAREPGIEPRIKVELLQASIFDLRSALKGSQRTRLTLPRGRWPQDILPTFGQQTAKQLVEKATTSYGDSPAITAAARNLVLAQTQLGRKIIAKIHERAASATACVLVLLLGATLSIQLRGQMPLVIYFWSFLLATVAVVIVRSGENFAANPKHLMVAGEFILWSGNLLIAGAIAVVYLKLSRN